MFESDADFLYAPANLLQFPINVAGRLFNKVGEILRIGDLQLAGWANRLEFIGENDVEQNMLFDSPGILVVDE